jgi:hypothetical protein
MCPLEINSSVPPTPARRRSVESLFDGIPLTNIINAPASGSSGLANTPGGHQRTACDTAMASVIEAMSRGLPLAGNDGLYLLKSLAMLRPGAQTPMGNIVRNRLTALGAMRAGLIELQRQAAQSGQVLDSTVEASLDAVEKQIVDIGISAGRCTRVPTGTNDLTKPGTALFNQVNQAEETIAACVRDHPDSADLLGAIARAVLPQALRDSIDERLPHLAALVRQPGFTGVSSLVHSGLADATVKAIQHKMSTGDGGYIISAFLDLMKFPEFVVNGQSGTIEPESSMPDNRPNFGCQGPAALREVAGAGAAGGAVLYNYSPNEITNDFSGLSDKLGPRLDVGFVMNLLDRERAVGIEIGDLRARLRQRNTFDRELDLESRLAWQNRNFNDWVKDDTDASQSKEAVNFTAPPTGNANRDNTPQGELVPPQRAPSPVSNPPAGPVVDIEVDGLTPGTPRSGTSEAVEDKGVTQSSFAPDGFYIPEGQGEGVDPDFRWLLEISGSPNSIAGEAGERTAARVSVDGLVTTGQPPQRAAGINGNGKPLLAEFQALVAHRQGHRRDLSPIKVKDSFRKDWKARGGMEFTPPVSPVARPRESVALTFTPEFEFQRILLKMNQAREAPAADRQAPGGPGLSNGATANPRSRFSPEMADAANRRGRQLTVDDPAVVGSRYPDGGGERLTVDEPFRSFQFPEDLGAESASETVSASYDRPQSPSPLPGAGDVYRDGRWNDAIKGSNSRMRSHSLQSDSSGWSSIDFGFDSQPLPAQQPQTKALFQAGGDGAGSRQPNGPTSVFRLDL